MTDPWSPNPTECAEGLERIAAQIRRGDTTFTLHLTTALGAIAVLRDETSPVQAASALVELSNALFHVEGHLRGLYRDPLDAQLSAAARAVNIGEELAREGQVTVALDEQGRLTRYYPDGRTELIEEQP